MIVRSLLDFPGNVLNGSELKNEAIISKICLVEYLKETFTAEKCRILSDAHER